MKTIIGEHRTISMPPGVILAPSGRPAALEALENNWYEGSRWSPNRSFIWFPVQDAKKDLDRYTRLELCRHARYLYKNSPLVRSIIERIVTLIVGSGFVPIFNTDNKKWNDRAQKRWAKRTSRNIHLGAPCSFSQYQRCLGRAEQLDGEAFSVETADMTVEFRNKIQGLESHRIGGMKGKNLNEGGTSESDTTSVVDGFNLNKQGIVQSYSVNNSDLTIDAQFVMQHFTPKRLSQYRGETVLASAINTARDVDDILAMEKQSVKSASRHKDVIETSSGQLDAEQYNLIRYGSISNGQAFPTVFNLPANDTNKDDYYRINFGAESVVLKRGDKYTPLVNNRPGSAWIGFMDFLSNTIGASTGFPISVLLPISLGGTDIHRDLEIAQRVVEPFQLDMLPHQERIVIWLMQDDVIDGPLSTDCPDGWEDCIDWQLPQKVNVSRDQSQQDRDDVAHGLMSLQEYHGRYGNNPTDVEAQVVKEAKARKENILAAGFKDVKEFVELISLESKMFVTRSQEDDSLATGEPEADPSGGTPPAPAPKKGKKK
jgi:hypothetical protein